MGPTGYRTSGFSGLINQQARQNGLPSFPVRSFEQLLYKSLILSKCKVSASQRLRLLG